MESKTIYFEDTKNPENTEITFQIAKERLQALGLKKIVIASTKGEVAQKALEFFKDTEVKLIVIPHQYDFPKGRTEHRFPQELVGTLRAAGHEVHIGTMIFHTDHLYGTAAPTLMANVLRSFSEGVKVCFEMVIMATDGGHLDVGEKVLVIAGTGKGADTALVMQAGSSQNFRNLRINEILCKPLNEVHIEEWKERATEEK